MTTKFKQQAKVYELFTDDHLDFSLKALQEMFDYESRGVGNCNVDDQQLEYIKTGKKINGFAVGKKNLNITVSMWKETLKKPSGVYLLNDLYNDKFPHWWLDKVLN